jgi:serine/threonine protein kinase
MVPSISLGTVLRHRYVIQKILGQGGFGRTYLALDQERFDELCVLKEFVVPLQDDSLIEKAKVLFQREANTLYQLQHPQIPRFWAAFEDSQRLFLVQDFVEGKTCRHLLEQRKQQGQAFSEPEVLHLLNHLLPVLSYIHDRQLIHRDISPENIILKTQQSSENSAFTCLPFLIDFGSVKAIAGYVTAGSELTRVGKAGYAPPEQLQTGKVHPHSDLYTLAATCLTLLTGKEPRKLLDSQTLTWQWQPHANLSNGLASILQKMLSIQPGDRYQSAYEVWVDLHPLFNAVLPNTRLHPVSFPAPASPPPRQADRESPPPMQGVSQYPRFNAPTTTSQTTPEEQSNQAVKTALKKVVTSWVGISAGTVASVLLGVGLATLSLKHLSPLASFLGKSPNPTLSQNPSNIARPTAVGGFYLSPPVASTNSYYSGSVNGNQVQPIRFAPGAISAVLQDRLQEYGEKFYVLKASQGQIMTVTLEGAGVIMNLLKSNQQGIDAASYQTRSWTGQLPSDDHYLVQISGSGAYSLDVAITPSTQALQSPVEQITFARGTNGATIAGKVLPNQIKRYALKAKRGQIISIRSLQGTLQMNAIAPTGQQLGSGTTAVNNWQGQIPVDGNYVVEIASNQASQFKFAIEIF